MYSGVFDVIFVLKGIWLDPTAEFGKTEKYCKLRFLAHCIFTAQQVFSKNSKQKTKGKAIFTVFFRVLLTV